MLNQAGVAGVPELILKQLVRTEHPITGQPLTHSTHILHALISSHVDNPLYQLHVLSCLVMRPRGYPIFEFTSLTELLIGFMDCITSEFPNQLQDLFCSPSSAHRDAIKIAKILHCDISLFNLLLILATDRNLLDNILQNLPQVESKSHEILQCLIEKWHPCCGLLAFWGYAVPTPDHPDFSSSDPSSELEHSQTLPILPLKRSTFNSVPVKRVEDVVSVPWNGLKSTDDIVIPMANDPLPKTLYNLNDKLYHTVRPPLLTFQL